MKEDAAKVGVVSPPGGLLKFPRRVTNTTPVF